jgi:AmmeMemoRadiSam system protein A
MGEGRVNKMGFDILGIIAPHPPIMVREVGRTDADVTKASARAVDTARLLLERYQPDTIVLMSPHATAYRDAFTVTTASRLRGDLGQFGAPSVALDVAGDPGLAAAILTAADAAGVPAVARPESRPNADDELDHGVLVPMAFLDRAGRWPLVELSLSYLPYGTHRAFGAAVRTAAVGLGRRVAFVASGDCSHRLLPTAPAGYAPTAHFFDERLVEALTVGDFEALATIDPALVEAAGECGLRSFITLGGFLAGSGAVPRVLAYEGPWGVGYLTAVFAPAEALTQLLAAAEGAVGAPATPPSGSKGGSKGGEESEIVLLARHTIERFVRDGAVDHPVRLADPSLPSRAGAFVSIHEHGELRGCIGTIGPTRDTLAEEVVHNAIEAATRDPRFPPIEADELDELEIKVDVLHEAEACGMEDLDPCTYGVIVSCDRRRGLLLPDLEGVDTAEQQVDIAKRKGGISPSENAHLERFKVDRHA